MEPKKFKSEEERKKIIDRIKKILAVANGTQYEAEADTAMNMAQGYMKSYGLSMTDIEIAESLEEEIVHEDVDRQSTPKPWERVLCRTIGIITDCQAVRNFRIRGSVMSFIGYKSDVEFAKLLFSILRTATRAAGRKEYGDNTLHRQSFYFGVSQRLLERAKEEKQTNRSSNEKYALIVVSKTNRVESWIGQNKKLSVGKAITPRIVGSAYERGRRHANGMDIMTRQKVTQSQGQLGIGYSK